MHQDSDVSALFALVVQTCMVSCAVAVVQDLAVEDEGDLIVLGFVQDLFQGLLKGLVRNLVVDDSLVLIAR